MRWTAAPPPKSRSVPVQKRNSEPDLLQPLLLMQKQDTNMRSMTFL